MLTFCWGPGRPGAPGCRMERDLWTEQGDDDGGDSCFSTLLKEGDRRIWICSDAVDILTEPTSPDIFHFPLASTVNKEARSFLGSQL